MAIGFADIRATRIQAWLDRTSRLRQRRGGSDLIKKLTGDDHVTTLLSGFPDVEVNPEAGQIDGVVALQTTDDSLPDLAAKAAVKAAALHVVAQIQAQTPTLGFEGTIGSGRAFQDASAGMKAKYESGQFEIDAPPAVPEIPFIRPCADCLVSHATDRRRNLKKQPVCEECYDREQQQERTESTPTITDQPADFEGLADPPGTTDIALIFADGNQIGGFKARLSGLQGEKGIPPLEEFASLLTTINEEAVQEALRRVEPARVVRHLAGGDDLLLSIEASKAWPFTLAYLTAFAARWRGTGGASRFAGIDEAHLPSTSAAIVFHHYSHPFTESLKLADGLLRHAKRSHRGRVPAIAFSRVTGDGDFVVGGDERPAVTLDWLTSHQSAIANVAGYPTAQRKTLRATLASAEPEATRLEAIRKAGEHGLADLTKLAKGAPAPLTQLDALAWVLDLTECWPH